MIDPKLRSALLTRLNEGAASTEPTVYHDNIERWVNRPFSANERAALAQMLPGKVIPCPCGRCGNYCESSTSDFPSILAAHMHGQMLRQYSEMEAAGFHTLHVGRVRRAWRALCALPARFEAWIDAADADHFFKIADAVSAVVFFAIIFTVLGGLLTGLIAIILEGRP